MRRIARQHLDEIDRKIAALNRRRDTASPLVATCAGDDRPECPILTQLSADG